MKLIHASGDHHDFGKQIGLQTAEEIRNSIRNTPYLQRQTRKLKDTLRRYEATIKETYPAYLEEIKGIAEGAGVAYEDILALNIRELVKVKRNTQSKHDDNCTTLTLVKDKRTIINHNEDGGLQDEAIIIKGTLPSGVRILATTYPGQLPGFATAITSNNTFLAANTLSCNHWRKDGIPKRFITRQALEAKDLATLKRAVLDPRRAQGQNYTFHHDGETYNIEASTREASIQRIKDKYAHCNNFLNRKLLRYEARKPSNATFYRNKVAQERIWDAEDEKDLKLILSSHEYAPKCICMHRETQKNMHTMANVIFDSSKPRTLRIAEGPTCTGHHEDYIL